SDRKKRLDETMSSVMVPQAVPIVLVIATVAAFIPGPAGRIAEAVAGAFGAAMALVGMAVIHTLTRGYAWRAPVLTAMYVLTVLSGVPLALLALAGIADTVFHIRTRRAKPSVPTSSFDV